MELSKLQRLLNPRAVAKAIKLSFKTDPDGFLSKISGVIHVGANTGQERGLYAQNNLNVIWIEPIPEIFFELRKNLAEFPCQQAYQYLVTDKDNEKYVFHVANNEGLSSSIFDLNLHKDIWPDVFYKHTITLQSISLPSLVEKERIEIDEYDALVMDTQGSELLILKGAETLLRKFKYIKTEVPDFESYSGCCHVKDMDTFLKSHGFRECFRHQFASRKDGGGYYDIVYGR